MKIKTICLFFALSFFFACDDPDTVWINLEVAECCNPWDEVEGIEPLPRAAIFLSENDIQIFDSELEANEPQVICTICCGCPTNSFVRFEILRGQLEIAESLGFLEE